MTAHDPDTKKWLTVKELAAEVEVSPMTIYRAVYSGELETTRVGRMFRVSREAWEAYLNRPGQNAPRTPRPAFSDGGEQ